MKRSPAGERVKCWKVASLPKLELLRATYITQSFSRHSHEGFAVGVIEEGALGFYYRGENVVAARGSINLANPDEPHTGHAMTDQGWTYRMFYLHPDVLTDAVWEMSGKSGEMPFFQSGVLLDDQLAWTIHDLHVAMEDGRMESMELKTRFYLMLSRLIRKHADAPPGSYRVGKERHAVKRALEFIEEHYHEDVSIESLASAAHLSAFHLIRVFSGETGLTPHAHLNQVRVRKAKELLAKGRSLSAVAAETGFADQSHFTRRFKRLTGMTPGQYSNFVQYNA